MRTTVSVSKPGLLSLLVVIFSGCVADDLSPTRGSDSLATSFCPPAPRTFSSIEITKASPSTLLPGGVVTIEGLNFDQLPANTVAWFYASGNSFTATSQLYVLSPTMARALAKTLDARWDGGEQVTPMELVVGNSFEGGRDRRRARPLLPEWSSAPVPIHALTPSKLLPSRTRLLLDCLRDHLDVS